MTKQNISEKLAAYIARNTPSWGNREYPLFTQDAANACPSARYVGGVSRWLCECRTPGRCGGVLAAAMGKPDGVGVESANEEIARLGVVTIDDPENPDGPRKLWSYRGVMVPRPSPAGDYLADLFRLFGIVPGQTAHSGRWHVRILAKVETGGLHEWETEINGYPISIIRYYVGQDFNIGVVDDLMCRPYRVEFIKVL